MNKDTSTRIKYNTLKELHRVKHKHQLKSVDQAIQYLINQHEIRRLK